MLDGTPVDLILLDVLMPGMDGSKFLEILRGTRSLRQLPVIVLSELSRDILEPKIGHLGVDEVLLKGENLYDRLLPAINRHLGLDNHGHAE